MEIHNVAHEADGGIRRAYYTLITCLWWLHQDVLRLQSDDDDLEYSVIMVYRRRDGTPLLNVAPVGARISIVRELCFVEEVPFNFSTVCDWMAFPRPV